MSGGGTPGPRRAETDRATMDPTLASTLRSAGQGQVDGGIFMGCLGACLFTAEAGGGPDVPPPGGPSGWTTLHKCRLMFGPQCFSAS